MNSQRFETILLGQLAGDSLGLPYEFLRRDKIQKRFERYGLAQSFLCGRGIVSDDSEHLLITAQALLNSTNTEQFGKSLGRGLKKWFLTLLV